MPLTRLPSRPRNSSRPPQPFSRSPNPSPAPASTATFASAPTRPTHGATKSVSLELGQDWEPNDLEEKLGINEIWNDIDYWEQALSEKGKLISGKTIVVVHALPYVCTLHTAPQVTAQPAPHARGRSTDSNTSKQDLSVETDNLAPPFPDLSRVDSAQDDIDSAIPRLEIAPGDPLLRPRGIHSPTVSQSAVAHFPDLSPQSTPSTGSSPPVAPRPVNPPTPAQPTSISSSLNAQRRSNLLGVSNPVFSFPSPGSSIAASSHPALPISRVGSPDYYAGVNGNGGSREDTGGNTTPTGLATPSTSYLSHSGSTAAANGSAQSQSSPASSFHSPSSQSQSTSISSARQRSKWILHPRRGHAALNSGIKSLSGRSGRELVVVGRPDDLEKVTNLSASSSSAQSKNYPIPESSSPGAVSPGALAGNGLGWGKLGQGELSARERRDLERGLKKMGGPTTGEGASGISCVPVWLEDDVHTNFYEGFCKTFLWPIFHYLALSDSLDKDFEVKAWEAYYAANLAYAKKVCEVWQKGDLIWIHDYHLLLVPKMIRDLLPEATPYISLFLHCPFPSSEYFRCLPRREQILSGMLGCDLVTFQTHSYARHFLSSCVRVMGYEAGSGGVDAKGSITRISHCPIGVDFDNVTVDANMPGVGPKIDALRRLYEGKKIIVGRDKLDPTKGVLPKLRAFERFLHDYPQWAGKVVLIQVTSPSSGDSPAIATKVSELVDGINAVYGTLEFQPVKHFHQTVERDEYFALLTVADVALVTSIRDGMNTTSMEYIICQKEAKGTLIVSEFTGVSAALGRAIKVNPWDLGGVARAIDECLLMPPDEKSSRHLQLYETVKSQTAAVWAATNILKLLESLQGEQATQNTPRLDEEVLLAKYAKAGKRLLLFDYDGTLTPIVKNPSAATPSLPLLASLETLAADTKNVVFIISGRDGEFLEEQLGHIANLGMSAEHGCFLRGPGEKEWISLTDEVNMDWKKDVLQIFRYYEARTMGSFVEKKLSSVTFHYRNADPVFGLFQAKECQAMLESMQESLPIDVLVGKKNVEVRPAHTNKGEIVQRLLYLYPDSEFVICAGDDKTDEDMFHAISRVFSNSTPGESPIIPAPQSLTTYPALTKKVALHPVVVEGSAQGAAAVRENGHRDRVEAGLEEEVGFPEVSTKLDLESMFTIAIDENKARLTIARATLETPQQMIDVLARMARVSSVDMSKL